MGGLSFLSVACAVLVVAAVVKVDVQPSRVAAVEAGPTVAPTEDAGDASSFSDRTDEIKNALAADAWPALVPDVSAFGSNGRAVIASEWITDGCLGEDDALLTDNIANTEHCVYGNLDADAAHTAVVYGDSVAISYLPALRQALGADWKVQAFTVAACPASAAATTRVNGAAFAECGAFRTWAQQQIQTIDPGLVLISEATDDNRLVSQATDAAAAAEWSEGARQTLSALQGISGSVVYLSRPPVGTSLYECQTAFSSPGDCITEVTMGYTDRSTTLRQVATSVGGAVSYVDTSTWFCNLGQCPVFVGTTPVLADGRHLTNASSISISPLVAQTVQTAQEARGTPQP